MPNSTYFFLLGRTPELSLVELQSLIAQPVTRIAPEFASAEFESSSDAERIFQILGGSLKVMKLEGEFIDLAPEDLPHHMAAYLAQEERPTFALAEFHRGQAERIDTAEIKKILKKQNKSSRFIDGPRDGLSAAVLLHHKVTELNIIQIENKTLFAKTLAVQDIDDWTQRDRAKPYADRKKGMLPPKLARIMVNMAVGQHSKVLVYDPFCGSGTVLMEALMRGCDGLASDLDTKAVQGTQANLEWLSETYQLQQKFQVFQADTTNFVPKQSDFPKVDALVTEPFLGKQTPKSDQLPNIFKGLEKLYLGAFKHWIKFLADEAKVVIVFPYVLDPKIAYSLENILDKLKTLGYTASSQPILYARPDATVQRQIWTFEYRKI